MRHPSDTTHRGFTLPELVLVLIIIGVLGAVALPRMSGMLSFSDDTWRQDVMTALRQARNTAAAARRLVCVSVSTGNVSLSIAAANPATSCSAAIQGPDGNTPWLSSSKAPATSSTTLYFQSNGRVSTDGAGSNVADVQITIAGQTSISITGESGYVE